MDNMIGDALAIARRLWTYRWAGLAVAWVAALVGFAAAAMVPDNFQTSARVFVDTQTILKPLLAGMTSVPNSKQQVAIMSRTLLSRPNLDKVMRMVDLDLRAASPRAHAALLQGLMEKIRITGSHNDIYTITYSDHSPKMVRDVVQALLTIFVEDSFKGKSVDSARAVQFLDQQIKGYETRLAEAEGRLQDFKIRNAGLLPSQVGGYSARLAHTGDLLAAARLDLAEAEQMREALLARSAQALADPALDGRIGALDQELDALQLRYTENHPDVLAAQRRRAQLLQAGRADSLPSAGVRGAAPPDGRQRLDVALAEAEGRVGALRVRVHEFTAREQRLARQSQAVPAVETELAQLNRDYEVNKVNFEQLISKREAAKLSGQLSTTTDMITFRVIDPPYLPVAPVGPNRPYLLSAALAAAVLAGLGTALLLAHARPTFASTGALRDVTGLNVLGSVSMKWSAVQLRRRRLAVASFVGGVAALPALYGVLLARHLLQS